MVGRRMVHSRADDLISSSAASRIRFVGAGSVVVMAVVDTNTPRFRPACSAAATMAGACPKPSEARLTSTSQRAEAKIAGSASG